MTKPVWSDGPRSQSMALNGIITSVLSFADDKFTAVLKVREFKAEFEGPKTYTGSVAILEGDTRIYRAVLTCPEGVQARMKESEVMKAFKLNATMAIREWVKSIDRGLNDIEIELRHGKAVLARAKAGGNKPKIIR